MYIFLSCLILIASILLIGIVLIQKSKGGGLASNFSGANQIVGVRNATQGVEKATWVLAIIVAVLSIVATFFAPSGMIQGSRIEVESVQTEQQATPFAT
ncbi:MAG: preprotein translocase subunit SecG, partial [Bacteroidales bacterium]